MDFKIAGTQNGITGIQLDLKIDGISEEIIRATLDQSREARIEILRKMLTAIPRPRPEISVWAPRLLRTHIDPEKIGLLIGPGGKMIRAIQEATGALIEVEDDGTVTIACHDAEGAQEAMAPRRGPDRLGRGRPDLRRPRDQRQGLRRVHRDPARQGRPVPHQRAGRRVRHQRRRRVQGGRRDEGQGDRHRRPGPREAQPQGGHARSWRAEDRTAAATASGDAAEPRRGRDEDRGGSQRHDARSETGASPTRCSRQAV